MYRSYLFCTTLLLVLRKVLASEPFQLTENNFTSFVDSQTSSNGILMEFYAHWCPTCQHFQPEYEKLAQYFNTEPQVQPGIVVARVDCADMHELCNRFKIGRYPTIKYGQPAAFAENPEVVLEEYAGMRTAKEIIEWLGQQKGVQYNFDATQEEQASRSSKAVAVIGTESGVPMKVATEADYQDLEKATVLAFKYALETPELLKGLESREAFQNFTDLVALAHPVDRCRSGAEKLQSELPKLWPVDHGDGPDDAVKGIQICSAAADQKDWRACKGSKESKRGYTCGLWLLLHTLSGRIEPEESGGTVWLTAVKGYVKHFFQCTDCAKHFTEMASEKAAQNVVTRKDAVLWAWRAHNEVNRRLESLEKNSGDGDPAFPKLQWPPSELCPLCRLPSLQRKSDVTWNEEEVYRFLLKFYMGIPEPQWVTQKLKKGTQMMGIGSRKSLEAGGSDKNDGSGRNMAYILIGLIVLALLALLVSKRSRRDRRYFSL